MEIQSMDLRKQVLQLRAVNFLHGLASSVMYFRVLYLSGIGLTATQSGIVMCLTMVMGTITPPLWGMLADSMRSKYRVFVLTVLGVSLTCALVPTLGPVRIGGLLLASAIIPLKMCIRDRQNASWLQQHKKMIPLWIALQTYRM